MKLAIICDDEFAARRLPECQADLLISLGDLPDSVILEVAERCHPTRIVAVKGNHDAGTPFPSAILDLHLKTFTVDGVTFGGFGGSWRYKPKGDFQFEQEEVEILMKGFPSVDIFIAHNSPRGIHDRDDEVHIGFVAFSNYITRAQPKFFLHGHQHHDEETTIGGSQIIGTFGFRILKIPSTP